MCQKCNSSKNYNYAKYFTRIDSLKTQQEMLKIQAASQLSGRAACFVGMCLNGMVKNEKESEEVLDEKLKLSDSAPKDKMPKEEETPEEVISNALKEINIDFDSQNAEFKSHILNKYDSMMRIYGDNKPSKDIINKRLINFARGYEFNKFEILAGQGATVGDFSIKASSQTDDVKQKYLDFGAQYVEFYDKNGDGNADIWEIFYQELLEQYMIEDKMDGTSAQAKAIEIVDKYSALSFEEIDKSTDSSPEMTLLKMVMTKVGVISTSLDENADLENLKCISIDEAAALGVTYTNFLTNDSSISSSEYIQTSFAIAEDSEIFKAKMQHSNSLLK